MNQNEEHEILPPDPPDYDAVADAMGSYYEAVRVIGERVKAGEPVPEFFRSGKQYGSNPSHPSSAQMVTKNVRTRIAHNWHP
jgi:hypothetical protein